MATAAYDNALIQGDVLPGFRHRDDNRFHQRFLFGRVENVAAAKAGLGRLLNMISTGHDVHRSSTHTPTPPFVNIAFTYDGLRRLGGDEWAAAFTQHKAFVQGLAARSKDGLLGDPMDWRIGRPGQVIHAVVNIGSPENNVDAAVANVKRVLGAAFRYNRPMRGAMLPGGTEHFGFRDGIAQPYVDDPAHPAAALPMNYTPSNRGLATRTRAGGAKWPDWQTEHAEATKDVPKTKIPLAFRSPGVPVLPAAKFVISRHEADSDLLADGSFMVWLKLRQFPDRFWAMCKQLAAGLNKTWRADITCEVAAALLMGRARDGTPVEPSPPTMPEDFSYYEDQSARRCPAGAHVRLMNPRDVQTLPHMILRRGIPYGAAVSDRARDDGRNRGLLFVCYQQSIENQYEVLQRQFANAEYELGQPASRFADPLISQRSREGTTLEIAEPYGGGSFGMRLKNTWIVPEGGLYLFVPSMKGLEALAR